MSNLLVRDLMQRDVMSVNPSAALIDVSRLFVAEEIHGAPVIDEEQRALRGVVSTADLLRASVEDDDLGEATDRTVADIMVRDVVTVAPDASIAEAAQLMRSQRIHRLIVVENHEVIGVLSTFDVIAALVEPEHVARHAPPGLGRAAGDPVC